MSRAPVAPVQPFHFYASCLYGWAVSQTKEGALAGAARQAGGSVLRTQLRVRGGLQVKVVRVNLPESAQYSISEYMPNRITKMDEPRECELLTRVGEFVPLQDYQFVRVTKMDGSYIEGGN